MQQHHINLGRPITMDCDPIVFALRDTGHDVGRVGHHTIQIDGCLYHFGDAALAFTRAFNAGEPVAPFVAEFTEA